MKKSSKIINCLAFSLLIYSCLIINSNEQSPLAGINLVGSYADTSDRALQYGPGFGEVGRDLTVTQCRDLCINFQFFALQAGSNSKGECRCDNDYQRATKYGSKSCGAVGDSWCNFIYHNALLPYKPLQSAKDASERALRYGPGATSSGGYGYDANSCRLACINYQYFSLQNGSQCFCENDIYHATQYGSATCGLTGGVWCNYIYFNQLQGMKEIGCFNDSSSRAMTVGPYENYSLDDCRVACKMYNYFALQNGNGERGQCFCENSWSNVSKYGSTTCDRAGASWKNYVYQNFQKYSPIGPYKDTLTRALPYGPQTYNYTPETCRLACQNYQYFGLQDGGQCFCGNSLSSATQYGASNCGYLGTAWCNYIYINNSVNSRDDLLSINLYTPIGSYLDNTSSRALRYGPQTYGFSAATCSNSCKSYKYFALQNGGQCFCDNDFSQSTKYGPANCGSTGDAICNYIYINNNMGSSGIMDANWIEVGCFIDKSSRALRYRPNTNSNTVDSCRTACSSYKIFSLQNNGECYCDDDITYATQYGATSCGTLGGSWANYIYINNKVGL